LLVPLKARVFPAQVKVIVMDAKKREALEAAGWRFGDAADFLGMTDEERQLLDARMEVALAIRQQRKALKLSQEQLATRIKTSQPRVAKIERAAQDVSFDQLLRAFAAVGGRIIVKQVKKARSSKGTRKPGKGERRKPGAIVEPQGTGIHIELLGTEG
jgi:predicted XRE-type DNA-binding protein